MMSRRHALVPAVLAIWLWPALAAPVAPVLPSPAGLELNLRRAGPRSVDVTLCNVSGAPLLVNTRMAVGTAAYPVEIIPELVDSRGASRFLTIRMRIGPSTEFSVLRPTAIHGVRLELPAHFGAIAPGRYTLKVSYRSDIHKWQGRPAWRGSKTATLALELR